MRRYSAISLEQLGVLVGELFLLEIDQLAERHLAGWRRPARRERVVLGDAALLLELGEARRRPSARCIRAAGVLIAHQRALWPRPASSTRG